jgi:Tfp pilus assembly protein FimT
MIARRLHELRHRREQGLTLVELIVYVALLGLIMLAVVGVFSNVMNTQVNVTGTVDASNQAQAAATQISNAIRSASAISVTSPTAGDQMLMTRTAKPGNPITWGCEAWYFQSAANASNGVGTIRFKFSNSQIAAPSSSALAGWTTIASGVTPPTGSTTIFNGVFSLNGVSVETFSFLAKTNGLKPQLITTTTATPLGNTGGSPCF